MPWSSQAQIAQLVIIEGPNDGLFVYSGTPAAGNLVASVASAAGSDQFGNAFQAGITSYDLSTSRFSELSGSVVTFDSTAAGSFLTEPGTVHLTDALAAGTNPTLTVDAPNAVAAGSPPAARLILIGQNSTNSGPAAQVVVTDQGHTAPATSALLEVQGTGAVSASAAAGDVLTVTNTHAGPTSPSVQLTAQSSGDQVLGIEVAGDADERFILRSNGEHDWGSGAAATDVSLNRSGVGVLSLTSADFDIGTAGKGLKIKQGANAKAGTAALVGGTISVPNASVTANSIILVGQVTPGGTVGAPFVSAKTPGTGFTVTSTSNLDTSTIGYMIVEPG